MKRWVAVAALAALMGAAGGAAATVGVLSYTHSGGSAYFSDCSPASPHDQDIGWAVEYPIVNGYWDGTYHPDGVVTRQQMATFLMRQTPLDQVGAIVYVDFVYFGGALFGEGAYQSGYITYEEYQANQAAMDWLMGLWEYQLTHSYSAAGASPAMRRAARAVRERLQGRAGER